MKALAALFLLTLALILGGTLAQPIAERWADKNAYQRTIEAIQAQDYRYQTEATATSRALTSAAAGPLALIVGLVAVLVVLDFYRQRRDPLVRVDGIPLARRSITTDDQQLILLLADKIRAAGIAQIEAARQPLPPGTLHYKPVFAAPAQLGSPTLPMLAAPTLASVPTFAQLLDQGRVGTGNPLVLGFEQDDGSEISGSWLDLYSTAIAGLPGTGKTTTQRFLACQTALLGARFAVIDPHAGASDDSLAATLAPLASAFICAPASDDKSILETVRYVADVGQRRITGKESDTTPVILWADELTALLGRSTVGDELAGLLEKIAQEYRKRHVFVCGSGQIWTAARATSELRDSFASAIVHRMKRNQARMLLPTEEAATVERLVTGHAVLWRTSGATTTIAVPNTTAQDVARVGALLGGALPSGQPSAGAAPFGFGRLVEGTRKAPAEGSEGAAACAEPPSPEAARIVALFLAGKSIPEIVKAVYALDSNGGRAYVAARVLVEQTIRQALHGGAR